MKIIVVTDPEFLPEESSAIEMLLESGAYRVHIRKPGSDVQDYENLLKSIRPDLRARLSLHDHFGLAARYGTGGIHLNGRNPFPPEHFSGIISRSCHSFEEVAAHRNDCGYLFISPIFDSISKKGYNAGFSEAQIAAHKADGLIDNRVFAMGGVCPDNMQKLAAYGFSGAAVLGFIWEQYKKDNNLPSLARRLEDCLGSVR